VAPYRVIHGADGRVWRTGAGRLATTCTPLDCCEPPPPPPPGGWVLGRPCACSETSVPAAAMEADRWDALRQSRQCVVGTIGEDGSCWYIPREPLATTEPPPPERVIGGLIRDGCCACCTPSGDDCSRIDETFDLDKSWCPDTGRVLTPAGPVCFDRRTAVHVGAGAVASPWLLPSNPCGFDLIGLVEYWYMRSDPGFGPEWLIERTTRWFSDGCRAEVSEFEFRPKVLDPIRGAEIERVRVGSDCRVGDTCKNSGQLVQRRDFGRFRGVKREFVGLDCMAVSIHTEDVVALGYQSERCDGGCDRTVLGRAVPAPPPDPLGATGSPADLGFRRREVLVGGVRVPRWEWPRLPRLATAAGVRPANTGRGCAGCGEDGGL